jgi:hypothetical protein
MSCVSQKMRLIGSDSNIEVKEAKGKEMLAI